MKYLNAFEVWKWQKKGEFDIDDELSIGDILYCINNKGVERDLTLGEKYTVDDVYNRFEDQLSFKLKETESRWFPYRFTKDPNHPVLIELNSKKYDL